MIDPSPSRAVPSGRSKLAALVLILLLATALRLHELNTDSLWGDEIHEALNAERDLATTLSREPLGVRLVAAHTFLQVGRQEFVFRFPYAMVGILSVAAMYRVGRALFDGTVGMVGAFLLAISAFHIEYSQEGRSYSFTVLLVLVSLYFLYLAVQDNQLRHWAGFAVATALSLANHPTAASVVASEIMWAILVLVAERLPGIRDEQGSQVRNGPRRHDWPEGRSAWVRRICSSRGVLLALSSVCGVLLALLLGEYWLSYLSTIGIRVNAAPGVGDYVAMRISGSYVGDLLAGYGAGGGVALLLFGGAFVAGIVCSAMRRQWRQVLLVPIWLLPPFLILPRITADVPFAPKHLIFLLPLYLLFVARGIAGTSELAGRCAGRLPRTRRVAWVATLVAVLGTVSCLSVNPVQAYYRDQKLDWRGVAALLRDQAEPGDLIFQLMLSPWEAVPYYMDGYPQSVGIEVVNPDTPGERELPVDVWWVLRTLRAASALELEMGPEFDIYPMSYVAVVHRNTPVADAADLWQLTTRMLLVQAQYSTWEELDWYRERLARVYDTPLQPPIPLPACLPESSDLMDHVQTLGEEIGSGRRLRAFNRVQTMRILHEALYPPRAEPDRSAVRALRNLGDRALASGDHACALELYSRAADGLRPIVESEPGDVAGWRDLANVLAEAERFTEAIRAYQRLIELAPEHARYRLRLARAYRANGQGAEAIAVLEQAIELAPSEPRLLLELGNTYLLLGRMDEAVAAYQSALEIDAAIVEAHYGLALAHDAQGETARAIHEYQAVIQIDPEHWLANQATERLVELDE